jgi:hypothetical protein
MRLLKNINFAMLIGSMSIIFIFCLAALIFVGAEEEGTMGDSKIGMILAKLFYVFRFPTHTIFWSIMPDGLFIFFGGLLFNSMFYGFLIERLFFWLGSKDKT